MICSDKSDDNINLEIYLPSKNRFSPLIHRPLMNPKQTYISLMYVFKQLTSEYIPIHLFFENIWKQIDDKHLIIDESDESDDEYDNYCYISSLFEIEDLILTRHRIKPKKMFRTKYKMQKQCVNSNIKERRVSITQII